jgi:hypothetical protein
LNDRLMIFGLVRRRQDHHGCEVTADPWRIDDDTATAWRRATDLGWRRIGDGPEHEPILTGSTHDTDNASRVTWPAAPTGWHERCGTAGNRS